MLPHYHGDGEFSYRARRMGFKVIVCRKLIVYHPVNTTESLNDLDSTPTLHAVLRSFVDIRSHNYFKSRVNIARLCCPPTFFVPFIVSDTVKAVLRTIWVMLFGTWVSRIRLLINRLLSVGTRGE